MSVRNLTNTTWKLKTKNYSGVLKNYYYINGTISYTDANGEKHKEPFEWIYFGSNALYTWMYIYSENTSVGLTIGTSNTDYFDIEFHFVSGDDVANTAFISWLEANAELQKVTDLTGSTWEVPSGWSATAGYGEFNIYGSFQLDNENVYDWIGALAIGYKYAQTSAGIIKENNVLMMGSSWFSNTHNFIITIVAGEGVTNTSLISWLYANGYMTVLPTTEEPEEPTTPTKKFTRLYLGAIAHTSNGKRFRKLQTTEYVEQTYTLSGKWVFNDTITQYMFDGYGRTWGNTQGFVSNGDTYTRILTHPRGYINEDIDYDQISYQKDNYGNGEVFVQKSTTGWVNDNYKTIEFNGTWVVDKEFYDWFTANATEYVEPSLPDEERITDLTNTTWHIPSGWSATTGYGTFSVNGTVNSENTNRIHIGYDEVDYGTARPNYISYLNTDIYIPRAITPSSAIALTITGGTDATNTKLIDWLKQYGTLTSHTMA